MISSRSLSPVTSMTGEELNAALRRSRRQGRQGFFDKQASCDSQDPDSVEQSALDRVRFDDNVSFIEATSPEMEAEARLKSDLASFKVRTRALDLVTPGHTDVVLAEM